MSERRMQKLWASMTSIYGRRWPDNYGEEVDRIWTLTLQDMTGEELAAGLRACVDRGTGYLPTLPEFRAMCRPPKNPIHRHLERDEPLALEDKRVAQRRLKTWREELKGWTREESEKHLPWLARGMVERVPR